MKIEFPILSVLSTAVLIYACMLGGSPSIDNVSITADVNGEGWRVGIHPVFRVEVDDVFVTGVMKDAYGSCIGNVILISKWACGNAYGEYLLAHERIHVNQFRALGGWLYPAKLILNIEPPKGVTTDWDDAAQPERTMWEPPQQWPFRWSLILLSGRPF